MPRADFRHRLGAMLLVLLLVAVAAIALLKGAWWVSLLCGFAWLALEVWPIWRRRNQRKSMPS